MSEEKNIKYLNNLLKYLLFFVFIFLLVGVVKFYLITPVFLKGESMSPTLKDGDVLLELKKWTMGNIKREDIVSIEYKDKIISKRVIGLPEEELEVINGDIYVNGDLILIKEIKYPKGLNIDKIKIEKGHYYVIGDNTLNSLDSRDIGTIENNLIVGKLLN